MEAFGPYLWAASGQGLVRFHPASDYELPSDGDWFHTKGLEGFGKGGVSAIAIAETDAFGAPDTVIWAATAIDTFANGENHSAGGGVGYSLDDGETWHWFGQPVDPRDAPDIKPTTTSIQNITYDIAILDNRVWLASFGGGLRYYDMDNPEQGWVNRPPDDDPFDVLTYMNHRAFSVTTLDNALWVGTANGINVSQDNGETWINYRHDDNNENSLSGDFVTAINSQKTSTGKSIIWASTWVVGTDGNEYYGVTKTENDGAKWERVLGSPEVAIRAHNIAFDDTVVYVCSDYGLFKSMDYGETWGLFDKPMDVHSRDSFQKIQMYCAATAHDRFYVGSPEGIAISDNGGFDWSIVRTYPTPGAGDTPKAYAYPNPFSPERMPAVRIQYSLERSSNVTLEIYDFAMELLIRPINNKARSAGDNIEVWDGRGPNGRSIANGVYFFRLKTGDDELWGKILIVD